jgi:ABC-type oligopeptide transport system substrate-binding subunit
VQRHTADIRLADHPGRALPLAKYLLAQAGYDDSHPLVFTLLYNTYESHQRIAIAASSM